jgi:ketosteroid isomerase-like protein
MADEVRTDLQRMLDDWAAAVRAHDISGVVQHHSDDILMFDVVGDRQLQGIEAYRKSWIEDFFPWHGTTGRFDLSDTRISAGQTVGFASSLLDCAGTEYGKPVAFDLRLTVGFERRAGGWTIIHEHHSQAFPTYRDPTT